MPLFSVRTTCDVQSWIIGDFGATGFASLVYEKDSKRLATIDNCYHLYFMCCIKYFFPKLGIEDSDMDICVNHHLWFWLQAYITFLAALILKQSLPVKHHDLELII